MNTIIAEVSGQSAVLLPLGAALLGFVAGLAVGAKNSAKVTALEAKVLALETKVQSKT